MNKIDAFGVMGAVLLVWIFAVFLVPAKIMAVVYMIIAAWSVGKFSGRLLSKKTDKDFLNKMFELNNEQSRVTGEMLQALKICHAANQASLARIDELMFEYCPEDMTPEQIANYEAHIKAVSQRQEEEINIALLH